MVSVLLVPVLLLVLVGGRMLERTVPVEDFTAPYVSLRDMESVPLGPYETIIRKNSGLSSENVAKRQFSLLAPAWYEVSQDLDTLQSGRRPGSFSPDPRGGEYTYSSNLDMTYVHTLPSWPGRWPGPKKKSGRWPPWDVADEWPCSATPEKRTWPTTWTCWPPW